MINDPNGSTTVGVRFTLLTDAVGHTHVYTPVGSSKQPGNYTINSIGDMVQTGLSNLCCVPVHHGNKGRPEGTTPFAVSSHHTGTASGAGAPGALQQFYCTNGVGCACRNEDPTWPTLGKYQIAPSLGMVSDGNGGTFADFPVGMEFGISIGGVNIPSPEEYAREAWRLLKTANPIYVGKQCVEGSVTVGNAVVNTIRDTWYEKRDKWLAIINRISLGEATDDDWKEVKELASDLGHAFLDIVGLFPVPGVSAAADLINSAWYAAEGKILESAISALGAIPGVGEAIALAWKGVKLAIAGAKTAKELSLVTGTFVQAMQSLIDASSLPPPASWRSIGTSYSSCDRTRRDCRASCQRRGRRGRCREGYCPSTG